MMFSKTLSSVAVASSVIQSWSVRVHKEGRKENASAAVDADDDPMWGCGLLGDFIPGIGADGKATTETQRLIDGIKGSSSFNMVNYWNWNFVPDINKGQYLTKDFIFLPEMWGQGAADPIALREAGETNFKIWRDADVTSPATMGTLLMGSNEPDIVGSCMGSAFGQCLDGSCCWQYGNVATGVGFWDFDGCPGGQPLPNMWENELCVDAVMGKWQQTAAAARYRGYKYLTTPLVAWNIAYAEKFIEAACKECHTIECGCPQYIGFHFYGYDCQPIKLGGYAGFSARLNEVKQVMEKYPFVKGAIVNEVGMLNCQSSEHNPICVPDGGDYPASSTPDGSCPVNDDLPNGMSSFMDGLFDRFIDLKTSDGRRVVKAFSWFQMDKVGGTYNEQLWTGDKLNDLGESYIRNCKRWEAAQKN